MPRVIGVSACGGAGGRKRFAPGRCWTAARALRPAFHLLGGVEAAGVRAGLFRTSSRKKASSRWLERLFTLACIHTAPFTGYRPPSKREGCVQYFTGLDAADVHVRIETENVCPEAAGAGPELSSAMRPPDDANT